MTYEMLIYEKSLRKRTRSCNNQVVCSRVSNQVADKRTGLESTSEVLNQAINGPDSDFAASNWWIWRWQKHHGVKQLKLVGEKRSADTDGAAQFPAKL